MGSKKQLSILGIAYLGIMLSIGTGWVWADEQTKEQAGDVQERALPRMTVPKVAPGATLAPKPKGAIVQGNQLKAAPGYTLKKGPNNTVSAMRAGISGPSAGNWSCACKGGTGACNGSSSGDTAVCSKDPGNVCNGTCEWKLGVTGAAGGTMMR